MAFKQEINAPLILTIGAVGGILCLLIVMGLQAWFLWAEQGEVRQKFQAARNIELQSMIDAQEAKLRVASRLEDGRTTIPIDQAMQVIVERRGVPPSTRPAQ